MKKHFAVFIIALSVLLCSCGGNANNVQINTGESSLYSSEEIEKAADVAIKYFKRNFGGCTMTSFEYDEQYTLRERESSSVSQYGTDEVIVFVSDFDVDSSGVDGSFSPNTTYSNWNWILARDDDGNWKLVNKGYG